MNCRNRSSISRCVAALVAALLIMAGTPPAGAADSLTVVLDFEAAEVGSEPEGIFVIDGDFQVVEVEGGKAVELAAQPLTESGFIAGESIKGAGSVSARVSAMKKRRSFPRFGIGMHGLSGYRLRLVPASGAIELVKNEEVVKTADFEWTEAGWTRLELSISEGSDGTWTIEGRAWADEADRPETPTIALTTDKAPGTGKASVWGTPYAGLPIRFDDIRITAP